jgi:hypothetical protein
MLELPLASSQRIHEVNKHIITYMQYNACMRVIGPIINHE